MVWYALCRFFIYRKILYSDAGMLKTWCAGSGITAIYKLVLYTVVYIANIVKLYSFLIRSPKFNKEILLVKLLFKVV